MSPEIYLYLGLGLFLGLGGCIWTQRLVLRSEINEAKTTANDMIEAATEYQDDLMAEAKQISEQYKEELIEKHEDEILQLGNQVETAQSSLDEKRSRLENHFKSHEALFKTKQSRLDDQSAEIRKEEGVYKESLNKKSQLIAQYIEKLLPIVKLSREEVKEQKIQELITEAKNEANSFVSESEQETQLNLEREARRTLNLALNRFARPYCPERGIGNVSFPNPDIFKRTVGPDRVHIQHLEKAAGVDITINEENHYASVLGFDPVRRELGRSSLEKLIHEKNLDEKRIIDIVNKTKKDLFKKIRKDGISIAKELGLQGLDNEILNMMGALRYRYSFAQNQYFHCSEVGWLCGLLSAELGFDIKNARRAGMLHDIGKAMDHSKEGGHAVIGADFIEKNGESADVVHAVRAHHFDEQPTNELCYLVIGADAISGARPGARRSTMDSYQQKMQSLQKIGSSFPGVKDTYILSAGREMRITVDSKKIDDVKALELSKQIATKIEEEMSYPGLIKVVVVRESFAVQVAK